MFINCFYYQILSINMCFANNKSKTLSKVAKTRIFQSGFYSWFAISDLLSSKTLNNFKYRPLALYSHELSRDLLFAHRTASSETKKLIFQFQPLDKYWICKALLYDKIINIQSTLDISKLMGLFFTSSNYPKCKLIWYFVDLLLAKHMFIQRFW